MGNRKRMCSKSEVIEIFWRIMRMMRVKVKHRLVDKEHTPDAHPPSSFLRPVKQTKTNDIIFPD